MQIIDLTQITLRRCCEHISYKLVESMDILVARQRAEVLNEYTYNSLGRYVAMRMMTISLLTDVGKQ